MHQLIAPDVYRVLVTQVLPGLVAVSSWEVAIYDRSEVCRAFVASHTAEAMIAATLIGIFFGLVCEDFGSRIEIILSPRQKDQKATFDRVWFQYLRMAFKTEPVGHKYLRSLVIRLKFETNGAAGLFVCAVGIQLTNAEFLAPAWISFVMAILGAYLLWEARETIDVLHKVRLELMKKVEIVG